MQKFIFGCLKSDFSRVQNYITSELLNSLSFHLCLLKLGVNVAQGVGGKINQTKKFILYINVIIIVGFDSFTESYTYLASMR